MNVSPKTLPVFIAVIAVAVAVGYYAGSQQLAHNKDSTTATEANVTQQAQTPTAHPPISGTMHDSLQPGAASLAPAPPASTAGSQALPPQSGQAHLNAELDQDAKFTHFRVGERNVNQILADGDTMLELRVVL